MGRGQLRRGDLAHIRRPVPEDRAAFLRAVRRSRKLHRPWVTPPDTPEAFDAYVRRSRRPDHAGFLICRNDGGDLAGAANVSEIVRGPFQSAFLGYYAFTPHVRKGYLREGLALVVSYAFDELGLHRIQANVRPENVASSQLLRSLGFRLESHSPRYLFLDGDWRDHLGFVRLNEQEPPPFGASGVVTLREVDSNNWRSLIEMRPSRQQTKWVAPVMRSLALALMSGTWQPLLILAGDRTVGFLMWARDPADGSYWIGGFVIDRRHQGKGYGRAALSALLDRFRTLPDVGEAALSYREDNVVAKRLYASLGFVETGEMEHDEIVARLTLRSRRRT
jgi:[ribosomal protein S5]-alanine N-acetyltransferase